MRGGLDKDAITGPSKVTIDMSLPISIFNSWHAFIAPTPEYSVEKIKEVKPEDQTSNIDQIRKKIADQMKKDPEIISRALSYWVNQKEWGMA